MTELIYLKDLLTDELLSHHDNIKEAQKWAKHLKKNGRAVKAIIDGKRVNIFTLNNQNNG